jgi:hypothetical protein
MKLTFIIPAHGNSEYLEECIHSLKNQTIKCEIIITTACINNWLRDLAGRHSIPIIVNESGGTIANDWNFALGLHTSTDIKVLAHQDDIYLPEYAFSVISFFKENIGAQYLFTGLSELSEKKISSTNLRIFIKKILLFLSFYGRDTISSRNDYWRLLAFGCPVPCPAVAYRASLAESIKFSNQYKVNLDWDAWSRLGIASVICGYIPKQLVVHRIHDESETKKAIASSVRFNEDRMLFARYWPRWLLPILSIMYSFGY